MKITFLGTGSMQPTRDRNLTSTYLNYENEHILFDCGEGTQRQMKIAKISPTKITKLLITHFHADHILGLGGFIRNLEANQYNKTLEVYGPEGLNKFYDNIVNSALYKPNIKVKLMEFKEGKIIDEERYTIEAFLLNHSVECYGFRFKEKDKRKINIQYLKKFGLKQHPILGELQKGKDIVWKNKKITVKQGTKLVLGRVLAIILDTGYSQKLIKPAKDADLLITECTFSQKEKEKALHYKHLTSIDAANLAKKAKAKKLILTHFSQRYNDVDVLLKEAKKIFKNTECAKDFLTVILK